MSALGSFKRLLPDQHPLRLSWHKAKAFAAAARYGFPAKKLIVIGVTGTDGKTTTVGMTAHILHECGVPVGALSTAFFRIKDSVTWNATQKTSPSPFVIQAFLRRLVSEGCTHAVIEYSSHGLVQGRTLFTWPAVAALTNTSPEHLDYHKTMEEYRAAKGKLFTMLKGQGTKVLNALDETYSSYRSIPSARTIAYASKSVQATGADDALTLSDAHVQTQATTALVHVSKAENTVQMRLPIAGSFNLENALCAVGCAMGVGIATEKAIAVLATFPGVPGRIERIDAGQLFSVFVDFTVTPASYQRTLSTVREMLQPGQNLLVLTGSCGDRMREKRPLVGKICSEIADVVVVTNEDPYTEDPEKIINEVWAGIDQSKTEAHRMSDRLEAIRFLFSKARPGDAVILCGKGSDTTMWVKDGQIPWNEREIARKMLAEMNNAH